MTNDNHAFLRRIECKSADEFLETLSPRGPLFIGKGICWEQSRSNRCSCVSGHSDARFKLIPSALRPNGPLARFARFSPDITAAQIRVEAELLRRFFSLADAAGLTLPEDSQALRQHIARTSREDYITSLARGAATWPPDELLLLIAIGQHHGLPTRLLDWTRSYRTAAYFAAAGAKERLASVTRLQPETKGRLSVWAFEYSRYLGHRVGTYRGRINEYLIQPPAVELVSAPHASNPNLHAQDGVFTVFRPEAFAPDSPIDRRPLNVLAGESLLQPSVTIFYEVTLPVSSASQLMWILSRDGIDASRMFPGYGGVVRCLAEE
jgi:hypothetical protein